MHKEMIEPTDETKSLIELEARDKRRLETFIDGVFAIAITLLGLGFVAPLLQHSSGALLVFFVSLWPKFLGYFLAFFLLAALLNNNWRQFQNIAFADPPLFFINVLFLAFIVLVPFATTVWTEYSDITAGVLFFHCVMLAAGLTLYGNWSYVKRHPYLLKKGVTTKTLRVIPYVNASLPIASAVAIGLAFVAPLLSTLAYALIILIMIMVRL
jgi:uncharacterized membrane protein